MPDSSWFPAPAAPVAVIGLACRFPDADDAPALLDTVLAGRRAFRLLPAANGTGETAGARGKADAGSRAGGCGAAGARYGTGAGRTADLAGAGATPGTGCGAADAGRVADACGITAPGGRRGALIEGWMFAPEAFGIAAGELETAGPAHWLALETAARALAAAGFPGGAGLNRDRIGVLMGCGAGEDRRPAAARWAQVRRALAESLLAGDIRADRARTVLRNAGARLGVPMPRLAADSGTGPVQPAAIPLATPPASVPAGISSHFGFRGGALAVGGCGTAALQAVAAACAALAAGDLDVALAGGVDLSLSLEPRAPGGSAGDIRIYDASPTGCPPGEGCGVVVLMRAAQARAAGLPVYAEIAGWGTASGGRPGMVSAAAASQLLALRRAYARAGADPREVQLLEGQGAATAAADDAELIALSELRAGARDQAALGSIAANIGQAGAAAGAAGLIKTVLSLATGIIPPTTGVASPHPLLRGDAALWLPEAAMEWPGRTRLAGVSAAGDGGAAVHLVLRHAPGRLTLGDRALRALPWLPARPAVPPDDKAAPPGRPAGRGVARSRAAGTPVPAPAGRAAPFLLHGASREELAAALSRVAEIARWLSDAELTDLSCQLIRDARQPGPVRAGLVAGSGAELASRARQAAGLLPDLRGGRLACRPHVFAAQNPDGRVTLLLSGEPPDTGPAEPGLALADSWPAVAADRALAALRWLDALDVCATAAVCHGVGELVGLAWAGVLSEADAAQLAGLRAAARPDPAVRLVPAARGQASPPGAGGAEAAREPESQRDAEALRAALAQLRLGPPRRRLIPAATGRELASAAEAAELIRGGPGATDLLAGAVTAGSQGATLLVETGPGSVLSSIARSACRVPCVSADAAGEADLAAAGAALFAAGAAGLVQPLLAGRPSRPFDLWRDRVFIGESAGRAGTGPEQRPGQPGTGTASGTRGAGTGAPQTGHASPVAARPGSPDSTTDTGGSAAGTGHAAAAAAGPGRASGAAGRSSGAAGRSSGVAGRSSGAAGRSSGVRAGWGQAGGAGDEVAGIAEWARCFTREPGPVMPAGPADDGPWRVLVAPGTPLRQAASAVFAGSPTAGRVLAVLGDPASPGTAQAALQAAREGMAAGLLVVLATRPGLSGLFAALHAEQPALGMTVLLVPGTAEGLALARPHARAEPGAFRELAVAADGMARELRPAAREPGGGAFPLGPCDVALVSRSSGAAALAVAQVLACCGAAVAVIGRPLPEEGAGVIAGLEELRQAGARIAYEVVNAADPADLALGIRRVERRLGPVTAVAHAMLPGPSVAVADISPRLLGSRLAAEQAALRDLLAPLRASPVSARRLRLILTFGSVAARYGVPGQGLAALAGDGLAAQAEAAAARVTGCRALHVDLPGWAGPELGGPDGLGQGLAAAGIPGIGTGTAARLLLKALADPGLADPGLADPGLADAGSPGPEPAESGTAESGMAGPGRAVRVAVHGRAGRRGPGAAVTGRFLREVRVHYPGIELVCDARLSLATDPYLADYRVDGQPVLPPVLALEALAEAASALAGRPLRRAVSVTLAAPVLLPDADRGGETLIRVCALARGDTITAVLRCAESGLALDHARADFPDAGPAPSAGAPAGKSSVRAGAGGPARVPGAVRLPAPSAEAGMADGAELYGAACFQAGRFRRIAMLPEITPGSCRALARGTDERPWFPPGTEGELLLGSPGVNDATLQVLQACHPARRVWPASAADVCFSGAAAAGAVEIRAAAAGPRGQRAWDVEALDAAGRILVTWHGLTLRESGLLRRDTTWPYRGRGARAAGVPAGGVPQPRAAAGTAEGAAREGRRGAGGTGDEGVRENESLL